MDAILGILFIPMPDFCADAFPQAHLTHGTAIHLMAPSKGFTRQQTLTFRKSGLSERRLALGPFNSTAPTTAPHTLLSNVFLGAA